MIRPGWVFINTPMDPETRRQLDELKKADHSRSRAQVIRRLINQEYSRMHPQGLERDLVASAELPQGE